MLNLLEIEKKKLDLELIETIFKAYPKNVRLHKMISSEVLRLEDGEFADIEINSANFKDTLTFKKCHFNGNVVLRNLKVCAQVSFINCDFSGDVTLFAPEVSGPISFTDNKIAGRLIVNGGSTPKLDIQSVSAKEISVKAPEVASRIQEFAFENITISGAIRIKNVVDIRSIDTSNSTTSTLQLRQLRLEENAGIKINESHIDEVVFDDLNLHKISLCFHSTLGENLYIRSCSLEQSKLVFEQVMLNGMFAIKQCSYLDSEIDISSITCPKLDFDDDLINFVMKREQNQSAIFVDSLSNEKRIQTLKLLKDKFTQEHRYDLEDAVFYILKNFESSHAIQQAKWWPKTFLYIAYFLNRFVMGWGVRLRNPLISTLTFVGFYSAAYYIILGLYEADKYVEYLGQRLTGISGASIYSVLAFFGQQADAKISGYIPFGLVLGEFVLGIAMTTIIVGILIRKLVR